MGEGHHADRIERWRRVATVSWALVGLVLLVSFALWMLGTVASALTPFVLALVVVFLLRRPVAALQARGVSRSLAVGLCYLVLLSSIVLAGVFIVPPLITEVKSFSQAFPSYYDNAYRLWLQIEREYIAIDLPAWVSDVAMASRESVVSWITDVSRGLARGVVAVGGQIVGFLVNAFLALALAFFVLRDLPTLKSELLSLSGPGRRQESLKLAGDVTGVLEGYIRGQLMIATIVGVATGVGLAILGVPYALVIGLIAGVANLVPYLGPIVGGSIAAISAAFIGWNTVVFTLIWIVALQQLESTFLQPKIMSHHVHMHPVLVILSLLVGATLFGLVGMILAVPIAAVGKVLFVHYYEKWTQSSISAEDGALFRKPRLCTDPAVRHDTVDAKPAHDAEDDADEPHATGGERE
ncbi:MAG: AI-2E family transporter [Clostridiales bacterium]|nr:AI-2E family transporter [Clostridiales bacterium]